MPVRYCLDTSVFINSWQEHYRIGVFPGVWTALDGLIRSGRLISCLEISGVTAPSYTRTVPWQALKKYPVFVV